LGLPTTDGRPHRLTGALCNNLPGGQPTDASKTPYHDPHGTHTKWLKRHTPHRTTNPLPHGGITRGLGYIWDSTELYPPTAHTMSLMCQGVLIEAPKSGSKAYRNTRIWQNHMPQYVFEAEHARVPKPSSRPIEVALEANGLSTWSTRPTPPHPKGERYPAYIWALINRTHPLSGSTMDFRAKACYTSQISPPHHRRRSGKPSSYIGFRRLQDSPHPSRESTY